METNHFKVVVPRDLAPLVPQFLNNRAMELASLESALQRSDYAILRRIAHRMKGLGSSYGFHRISTIGIQIENAAKVGKSEELHTRIAEYGEYLTKVQVCYT
jgi:HPt (histidine-containing phosphotransfer) domain-containing protein